MFHFAIVRTSLCLVAFAALAGILSAQIVVDSLLDTTGDPNITTLRDAYNDVPANGTITFDSGLDGGTITLGSSLSVSKNVTIDASALDSLSLSGNNANRVFVVQNGARLTISGLTVRDGSAVHGGGIFVQPGGSLHVEGCNFEGNSTTTSGIQNGGAIHVRGSATVRDSQFTGNHASREGGAVGVLDFAGSPASLSIERSSFYDNSAGNYGGAIAIYSGNSGTVDFRILNSTVTGNSADNFDGGGIDIALIAGSGTISGWIASSTVTGNHTGRRGGGLAIDSSSALVNIANSIFDGNTAATSAPNIYRPSGATTLLGGNILANNSGIANLVSQPTDLVGTAGSPVSAELAPRQTINGLEAHPLLPSSPAIDHGVNELMLPLLFSDPTVDQSGAPRIQVFREASPKLDAGAVEMPQVPPTLGTVTMESIDDGTLPGYTNSLEVRVVVTPDASSARPQYIQISRFSNMAPPIVTRVLDENLSTTYDLPSGLGDHTIYFRLANDVSTASEILSDTITVVLKPSPVSLSSAAGDVVTAPFQATATFSQDPVSFSLADVVAENATLADLSGGGSVYEFTVNPISSGPVAVSVLNDKVPVASGLLTPSEEILTRTYSDDTDGPIVAMYTASSHVNGPFTVNVHFSKAVASLTTSEFSVTGGSAESLTGGGSSFALEVAPSGNGPVEVALPLGAVLDLAGNPSVNAASVTVTADDSTPTATFVANTTQAGGDITVGYTADGVGSPISLVELHVIRPGSASFELAGTRDGNQTNGTFDVTATENGEYLFALRIVDQAGNEQALVESPTVSILFNTSVNGLFSHEVAGDGIFLFPMTDDIDIAIEVAGHNGTPGGTIGVQRILSPSLPGDLSAESVIDESLTITGDLNGGTATLTWNMPLSNLAQLSQPFTTVYQYESGSLVNSYIVAPNEIPVVIGGISSFSEWYVGTGASTVGNWRRFQN